LQLKCAAAVIAEHAPRTLLFVWQPSDCISHVNTLLRCAEAWLSRSSLCGVLTSVGFHRVYKTGLFNKLVLRSARSDSNGVYVAVCARCCRAGLDPDTEQLLREFDQVVYISCNPETLAKNLTAVADTHDIQRFAVFDQVRPGTSACGGLSWASKH
jgi:hypothetical protein